ncbi:glyoxalase/bleomycin resistance protein/dioxygenase, partial [Fusarium oxysporum f. sp. albedinis]
FWLRQHTPGPQNSHAAKPTPIHVSFYASEPKLVDEFHAAGIRAGGTDNGQPGERPWFQGYYAAYILDLDGNNIEVVCFL